MAVRRTVFALLVILPILVTASCGPSGSSGVSAVRVDPDEVELVVGEHRDLVATVDATGSASEEVAWSSDDASVATVNQAGHVSAVAEGVATVTATSVADPNVADDVRFEVFAEGAARWTRRVSTDSYDEAVTIAVDGSNHVLVGGSTAGALGGAPAGDVDAYVRKLDPEGNEVWSHQFGTADEDEVGSSGLATDSENAVLVGATVGGPVGGHLGANDALLRKLDPTGEVAWTRQFGTPQVDELYAVAVGPDDTVVAVGQTRGGMAGVNAGQEDAYVRKFDSDGSTLWTRQFGTASRDAAWDVAVDATGRVVVAGDTNGALAEPNSGDTDVWVRRLDADGTTLWTRQFGTGDTDYSSSVAVDPNDHILIAGTTAGTLGASRKGDSDAFVRKLHPEGPTLWTRQFGSAAYDSAHSVATDSGEHVIVVGATRGDIEGHRGDDDGFVRKLDTEGQEVWTRQFGSADRERGDGVAVDGADRIFVAGPSQGELGGPLAGRSDGFVRAFMR